MRKRVLFFCLIGFVSLLAELPIQSYGDNALVLPKGVVSLVQDGKYYLPIDKKFNDEGKEEDIAKDFNANLTSSVFPKLSLVEKFFGMPAGSASIGKSVVSFEFGGQESITLLQYGLTDRLTLGARIPYYWRTNKVNARVDNAFATVGKNPLINSLAPLTVPGTVPLTTSDVQHLIGKGLDINGDGKIDIKGLGFKPVTNWSDKGFSDIELGAKYQYLKTDNWRLAFTGGLRLPTGKVDDPDILQDVGLGSGAYALLFYLNNDYIVSRNFFLNGTLRYELVLPHHERLRIPDDVHKPLTPNMEDVDRNLGDVIELETSGTYEFLRGFFFSLLYKFGYKMRDTVSGNMGFNYESVESETRTRQHVGIASLSYSTIPLFQAGQVPYALIATVSYRNRFAGTNVLKSDYLSLTLSAYF